MNTNFTQTAIALCDGQAFDFADITAFSPTPYVIAHGLSNVCRYAGQSRRFYSVAEHSYHVSNLVAPPYQLQALLHDASEAFIGDVVTPFKKILTEYRAFEEAITAHVHDYYGFPEKLHASVKEADLAAYFCEFPQLFLFDVPSGAMRHTRPPVVTFDIQFWSPAEARDMFLRRFKEITGTPHYDYKKGSNILRVSRRNAIKGRAA